VAHEEPKQVTLQNFMTINKEKESKASIKMVEKAPHVPKSSHKKRKKMSLDSDSDSEDDWSGDD